MTLTLSLDMAVGYLFLGLFIGVQYDFVPQEATAAVRHDGSPPVVAD